jgi:hypothetical protein
MGQGLGCPNENLYWKIRVHITSNWWEQQSNGIPLSWLAGRWAAWIVDSASLESDTNTDSCESYNGCNFRETQKYKPVGRFSTLHYQMRISWFGWLPQITSWCLLCSLSILYCTSESCGRWFTDTFPNHARHEQFAAWWDSTEPHHTPGPVV